MPRASVSYDPIMQLVRNLRNKTSLRLKFIAHFLRYKMSTLSVTRFSFTAIHFRLHNQLEKEEELFFAAYKQMNA